jgi:hypothetical protein
VEIQLDIMASDVDAIRACGDRMMRDGFVPDHGQLQPEPVPEDLVRRGLDVRMISVERTRHVEEFGRPLGMADYVLSRIGREADEVRATSRPFGKGRWFRDAVKRTTHVGDTDGRRERMFDRFGGPTYLDARGRPIDFFPSAVEAPWYPAWIEIVWPVVGSSLRRPWAGGDERAARWLHTLIHGADARASVEAAWRLDNSVESVTRAIVSAVDDAVHDGLKRRHT